MNEHVPNLAAAEFLFVLELMAERGRLHASVAAIEQKLAAIEELIELYESPPEKTLPAKTSSAEREGGDSSAIIQETEAPKPLPESTIATPAEAKTSEREPLSNGSGEAQDEERSASPPIQESVPDMHQGQTEVVTPSSDESVTGREAALDALPATHSPETASEEPLEPNTVGCGPQGEQNGTVTGGERPAQISEESRERQTAGENPVSKPEASIPEPMKPEETAAIEHSGGVSPGKSGEAAPSASPALSLAERIKMAHLAYPEWTSTQVADHLGAKRTSVSAYGSQLGIKWPGARSGTLSDEVAALHEAHPDWSGSQIASELDVGTGSVFNIVKRLGLVLPQAPNGGRAKKPGSAASRVEAYHRDHPEASASEIAAALDLPANTVRAAAVTRQLTFRKLTQEERSAVQRQGQQNSILSGTFRTHRKPAAVPVEARAPVPSPTPAPEAEQASEPATAPQRAPAFEAGDPDEDYIHPSLTKYPAKPTGNKVSLKDQVSGFYLHDSVTVLADQTLMLTADPDRAWRGTRQQLHAVRAKFPTSAKLVVASVPVRRKA